MEDHPQRVQAAATGDRDPNSFEKMCVAWVWSQSGGAHLAVAARRGLECGQLRGGGQARVQRHGHEPQRRAPRAHLARLFLQHRARRLALLLTCAVTGGIFPQDGLAERLCCPATWSTDDPIQSSWMAPAWT